MSAPIHAAVYYSTTSTSFSSFMAGLSITYIRSMRFLLKKHWAKNYEDATVEFIYETSLGSLFIGCLISSLIINLIRPNKKRFLLISSYFYIIGYGIQMYTHNLAFIITSRVILGIASGISHTIVPLYISYISPSKHKMLLVSFHTFFFIIGSLMGYFLGAIIPQDFQAIIPWICIFLAFINAYFLGKIIDILDELNSSKVAFKNLFKLTKARKSLLILFIVQVIQHICGFDFIIFFPEKITLQKENIDISTSAIFLSSIPAFLISYKFIHIFGRKPVVALSSVVLCISSLLIGISLFSTVALFAFIFFFTTGFRFAPSIICSEIFPVRYYEAIYFTSSVLKWSSASLGYFISLPIHRNYKEKAYLVYSGITFIFAIVFGFFFRESKNRPYNYQ